MTLAWKPDPKSYLHDLYYRPYFYLYNAHCNLPFILLSGNNIRRGIFSIYNFNNDEILELRFIDENFQVRETNIFKINMEQQILENSIINRVALTKGILTINSFSPSGEDTIHYVQTILRENDA